MNNGISDLRKGKISLIKVEEKLDDEIANCKTEQIKVIILGPLGTGKSTLYTHVVNEPYGMMHEGTKNTIIYSCLQSSTNTLPLYTQT